MKTNCKLGWIAIGVDEDFKGVIPCTALDKIPWHDYGESGQNNEKKTYRSVLNTMTTISTKNPSARSASRERRKERYMTSIVLSSRDLTSVGRRDGNKIKEHTAEGCCYSGTDGKREASETCARSRNERASTGNMR
jgi:hypothetical protein